MLMNFSIFRKLQPPDMIMKDAEAAPGKKNDLFKR